MPNQVAAGILIAFVEAKVGKVMVNEAYNFFPDVLAIMVSLGRDIHNLNMAWLVAVEDAISYVKIAMLAIFQLVFNCSEERVFLSGFLDGMVPFSFDVILELEIAKQYSITLLICKNVLMSIRWRWWLPDHIFAIWGASGLRP